MANLGTLNMDDAKELGEGFRIIPPGEYQVIMENSEWRDTKSKKDGTSQNEFLECRLLIIDGEYEGSTVICRLNLRNENQTAVEIAKSQFRALCEATLGQPVPLNNDSSSLHSRPFFVFIDNVPMTKDDPNSKRSNEVKFSKGSSPRSLQSGPAAQVVKAVAPVVATVNQAAVQATPAPAVKPGVSTPPWKKK